MQRVKRRKVAPAASQLATTILTATRTTAEGSDTDEEVSREVRGPEYGICPLIDFLLGAIL